MIEGINRILQKVSGLQKQIQSLRETPQRVQQEVVDEISEGIPRFDDFLNRKKVEAGGDVPEAIQAASRQQGIDEELIRSVIEVESGYDPTARSSEGAIGLMQLMPDTARELGVDPEDPVENIHGGTKYLAKMIDKYGNLKKALAAYNAGPGAVDRYDGVPPFDETQNYVKKVLSTFRKLKQE